MRRCNQLVKGIAQLLCVGDLFLLILLLQDSVEVRYNITVYLAPRQHKCVSDENRPAHMVCPESTMGSQLRICRK